MRYYIYNYFSAINKDDPETLKEDKKKMKNTFE